MGLIRKLSELGIEFGGSDRSLNVNNINYLTPNSRKGSSFSTANTVFINTRNGSSVSTINCSIAETRKDSGVETINGSICINGGKKGSAGGDRNDSDLSDLKTDIPTLKRRKMRHFLVFLAQVFGIAIVFGSVIIFPILRYSRIHMMFAFSIIHLGIGISLILFMVIFHLSTDFIES
ncbi:hypothetical protein AYI68_g89 [Smittium mucronatum]|uniref:Uncharacterized protein n=1 Tax=Smittium mucronatum TaxID=133383 RepID=A0A1R0H9E1_9FUNG|nr:hypothetical protein AYI68_g89 [Smittium mucronatum]